ncbi:MAG: methionyl-tRNA formyltransferase [Bacteroidetes bacterium]|nr:methionyl-tRNA formyltransferase [Bacteroidota bacterium]
MKKLKIIFLGTSEFAIPSLKILLDNGYDIPLVITVPDKPQGRGRKVLPSPIKKFALENNLKILQPSNLKDESFLKTLREYKADLQVVVAFRILPREVWNMPKFGTLNLHASLLPQYRGAAPINWAIINGEEQTGVTTFFLDDNIDTGKIALMEYENINNDDNVGTLYERLKIKGANLVLKTIKQIENNTLKSKEQPKIEKQLLKKAPKIKKEDCEINWNDTAENIYNFVRGLSPIPCAWSILKQKHYKIFKVDIYKDESKMKRLKPGEILTDNKSYIYIGTTNYAISILTLKPEGKRSMNIKAFLMGNTL